MLKACGPRCALLQAGMFEPKVVPKRALVPLAAAYVGYIVLCNLNLNINPVRSSSARLGLPCSRARGVTGAGRGTAAQPLPTAADLGTDSAAF